MMNRLRSRALLSLCAGVAAIGSSIFLTFFSAHPDEKLGIEFHAHPLRFGTGMALFGASIALVIFVVLSLTAWGVKRWFPRASQSEVADLQLYSPNQAFGAVILGGPLAAVSLLKTNYLTLGTPANARKTVVVGWSFFLVFVAILTTLTFRGISLRGIGTGIGVANAVATKSLVSSSQTTKQAILQSDKYHFKSNWRVVGLGLFYLAVTLAIIFMAACVPILAGYEL